MATNNAANNGAAFDDPKTTYENAKKDLIAALQRKRQLDKQLVRPSLARSRDQMVLLTDSSLSRWSWRHKYTTLKLTTSWRRPTLVEISCRALRIT